MRNKGQIYSCATAFPTQAIGELLFLIIAYGPGKIKTIHILICHVTHIKVNQPSLMIFMAITAPESIFIWVKTSSCTGGEGRKEGEEFIYGR